MLRGSCGDVSGFQTIATCRYGWKNSRDKSATSPVSSFESTRNGNFGNVRDKSRGSRRPRGQINGDVTGLSRTSRGSRHNGIRALELSTPATSYTVDEVLAWVTHSSSNLLIDTIKAAENRHTAEIIYMTTLNTDPVWNEEITHRVCTVERLRCSTNEYTSSAVDCLTHRHIHSYHKVCLYHSSKIRILRVFENPENVTLRFFEVAFQKTLKNVIQKFQVSEYIQHYIKIVDFCIYVYNLMALHKWQQMWLRVVFMPKRPI